MASEFEKALLPFGAHIEDVKNGLTYWQSATRVKAHLGQMISWNYLERYQQEMARDFMALKDANETTILNGVYITTIAAFEEFLRRCIEAAVTTRLQKVTRFGELGESMISRHFRNSGWLLTQMEEKPDDIEIDPYIIARRLGSCASSATDFELNVEAIKIVSKITLLKHFFDRLREIGYQIGFDDVARVGGVKQALNVTRNRDARNQLEQFLRKTTRNRNRIAHTGSTVSDVTYQSMERDADILLQVARAVVRILETQYA